MIDMPKISLHYFQMLVAEALDQLPSEFVQKLENVAVTVKAWPTFDDLASVNLVDIPDTTQNKTETVQPFSWRPKGMLFGLYQGVPRTKQQSAMHPPAKITLYAGPIIGVSNSFDELKTKIVQVLKHEIGHHFGMSDGRLHSLGY